MKKRLRLGLWFLTFLLMLTAMGCGGEDSEDSSKGDGMLTVYSDRSTEYSLIIRDRASDSEKNSSLRLRQSLIDHFGTAPDYSIDWVPDVSQLPATAKEILVGDTNRPESAQVKATLTGENSYAIQAVGDRIVIVATNNATLDYAVDYFIETYINPSNESELKIPMDTLYTTDLGDLIRQGWTLSCPAPTGGTLAEKSYNAGPGLADDTKKTTSEDSYMQVVTGVKEDDFNAYLQKFNEAGYTQILNNQLDKNRFAEFTKLGKLFHVSFFSKTSEIRVVEDNVSVPLNEFGYTAQGNAKTTLYQYGLYYDPQNRDNTGNTINCGMMYVIKLSDNSLIMIDGGHLYQCSDEAIEGLWNFLHEITGTADGDTLHIAAWYITHAHGDHVTGCAKLLNRHHDEIDLQRMMYNFPSYQVRSSGYDSNTTTMKKIVRQYYPNVAFEKLHSGQTFPLADVQIEILYTHEDAVKASNLSEFPLGDYNCTSTILRLTIDGKTVLFLGDTNTETESVVTKLTSSSLWKSDVVQIAHHCFNYLNTLYKWISAPTALLPNSYFGGHTPENTPKLNSVLKYVKDDQIFYEGEGTYGFQVVDGNFVCVYEAPVIGTVYDNSGI